MWDATDFEEHQTWAGRNRHWLDDAGARTPKRARRERRKEPLILCGHGVSMRVDGGTLIIRDGRTHFPQTPDSHRFFKGDLATPPRIILLDGSGSISFDVLDWLAEQNVPLVRLTWDGEVRCVLSGNGFAADREKVRWQADTRADPKRRLIFSLDVIGRKITGSIETLEAVIPASDKRDAVITRLRSDLAILDAGLPADVTAVRAVEARSSAAYFSSWHGLPLKFTASARRPVPDSWRVIGSRSAMREGKHKNRRASHPLNAMLNYAYAALQGRLTIDAVAAGHDPTIGIMHHGYQGSAAYIFDLMEPKRPNVDRAVLNLAFSETFTGADFVILSDGVCRLAPQLARRVCAAVTPLPTY